MLIDETVHPIDIWTTIDIGMQRAAEQAINANAPQGAQGALVALDRDGAVRAMVGGRNYAASIYNRATQATRQPGSSFKLFVYLAALESGYRPDSIVEDGRSGSATGARATTMAAMSARCRCAPPSLIRSTRWRAAGAGRRHGRSVADMAQRFGITSRVNTNRRWRWAPRRCG